VGRRVLGPKLMVKLRTAASAIAGPNLLQVQRRPLPQVPKRSRPRSYSRQTSPRHSARLPELTRSKPQIRNPGCRPSLLLPARLAIHASSILLSCHPDVRLVQERSSARLTRNIADQAFRFGAQSVAIHHADPHASPFPRIQFRVVVSILSFWECMLGQVRPENRNDCRAEIQSSSRR
jgi:hypothetical protein